MSGGSIVTFDIVLTDEPIMTCSSRILYWWEEQGFKADSVIKDRATAKKHLDESALMRKTMNASLQSVQQHGKIVTIDDLDGKIWSDVLKHSFTRPWYAGYVEYCGMNDFAKDQFIAEVKLYLDPSLRDKSGEYVAPPELLEFEMLLNLGGLSRSDLRGLSFSEFRKLQIVCQMLGGKTIGGRRSVSNTNEQPSMISASALSNPNLTPAQVKNRSIANNQTPEVPDAFKHLIMGKR